jgi:hypothetical protein
MPYALLPSTRDISARRCNLMSWRDCRTPKMSKCLPSPMHTVHVLLAARTIHSTTLPHDAATTGNDDVEKLASVGLGVPHQFADNALVHALLSKHYDVARWCISQPSITSSSVLFHTSCIFFSPLLSSHVRLPIRA